MSDPSTDHGFDLERAYDCDELAAVVDELKTALTADKPLWLTDGERATRVTFPSHVVATVGTRHDDAEPTVSELTLTLEWDDPDGSRLRLEDGEDASELPGERPVVAGDSETDASATDHRERTSRFEVYEDRAGQWRWRLVHWNGNIIADSGEGYASRSNARRAARGVMRNAPTATLEDGER
ncbi:YegP family protein [Natronorubrum sulfidifaciens]|uniref:DUF1508 domain-containing protein n=1 Tax=Natronorubrum sulfidifaciens JCM 14089 TaxID=1230460 RepID=L9WH31_9EURY|nr:YegP family protein [Natronorubrum sulfidifaciens]ELY47643.1 hypothetical protein C495_05277 [Natronorubrum sulfidifaciens JCM 14089]